MKRMTTLGLATAAGLAVGMVFWGAKTLAAQAQQQDGRAVVLLSIEVTDSKGHYINGLQLKDFRILEDGIIQKLNSFEENRNSYNATYLPAENSNKGFRKIEVQIVSDVGKNYRVRHKPGYRPQGGF